MSEHKIIAVVGATGAQGGGLVQAILNDSSGEFKPRAITRKPDSDKAMALAAKGVEVVTADLDDMESLNKAFAGAYGVFCVTNFWEHFSPEKELQQASNQAQAAKKAGVQHVIWSSLEDTRKFIPLTDDRMPTLKDKYKVPHFDCKGEANQEFTNLGLPVTILNTSFYWENFIFFGLGPTKGPDGVLGITFPMGNSKLPGISVQDIGKSALAIFKRGSEFIGKTVGISGDQLTGTQMAELMSQKMGQNIRFNDVPPEVYRGFGFPGADDMGNMFQFKRDFEDQFCSARTPEFTRTLNPELLSFDKWLDQNKDRIPLG